MRGVFLAIVGILLLAYPVVVYFGLSWFSPRVIAIGLLALLALRLLLSRKLWRRLPWVCLATVLGMLVLGATLVSADLTGMLLYPVAVNLAMLLIFAYSLWQGPPVIETLARIQDPDLDAKGVRYTRQVTWVWCGFFVFNGTIAGYTALFTSLKTWTLYNGLIAYLLMGMLMAGEWCVRKWIQINDSSKH